MRLITSVGEAVVCPVSYTLASNQVAEQNKAKAISVIESSFGIGMTFGPTIGGWLSDVGGFGFPFWSFAVAGFTIWIMSLLFLKSNAYENEENCVSEIGWREVLRSPGIGLYVVGTALGGSCWEWVTAPLEPYLSEQFGLGSRDTGLIMTANSISYTLMTPVIGFIIDLGFSPFNAVCLGSITGMVSMLLLGPFPGLSSIRTIPVVVVAMIIMGFGFASSLMGGMMGLLELSKQQDLPQSDKTHGMMSSLWLISLCLGSFVGTEVGSVIYDYLGFSWACTVEAIILSLSLIVFSLVAANRKFNRNGYHNLS